MNLLYVVKQFKANMVIACHSYIGYNGILKKNAAKIRLSIDYDIISPSGYRTPVRGLLHPISHWDDPARYP